MSDPSSSSSRQPDASSSSSSGASSSSSSSAAYYPLSPHPTPSSSDLTLPISLREPPSPDLIPATRPTLTQFRQSEGASTRAQKLKALWQHLPSLPEVTGDGPSPTASMQLPGQDTYTALSPERAERLRRLYEEELVKRVGEQRPEARLWGGADDQEPEIRGKGIAWQDFR